MQQTMSQPWVLGARHCQPRRLEGWGERHARAGRMAEAMLRVGIERHKEEAGVPEEVRSARCRSVPRAPSPCVPAVRGQRVICYRDCRTASPCCRSARVLVVLHARW